MARTGQGAFQIPLQIFDWPVCLARERPQRPPVVRLRFQPDGVEEYGGRHVVSVRDERDAHPGADRLILPPQTVGMPAGAERENECTGNGHAKGHRQNK
jgi:hypothetical protein